MTFHGKAQAAQQDLPGNAATTLLPPLQVIWWPLKAGKNEDRDELCGWWPGDRFRERRLHIANCSQSCRWSGGGVFHVLTRGWCPLYQEVAGGGLCSAFGKRAMRILELHSTWSTCSSLSWVPRGSTLAYRAGPGSLELTTPYKEIQVQGIRKGPV